MNILKQFLKKIPNFKEVQESPVVWNDQVLAHSASVVLLDGQCIGSGFSNEPTIAKQIAISEALERKIFFDLLQSSDMKEKFLLDEYPSTCGFSVGLDKSSSSERAVAEAVERWVVSKWIDNHFFISELSAPLIKFSPVDQFLTSHFEEIHYFSHQCIIEVKSKNHIVNTIISIGLTENGAFYGGKSTINSIPPITSALVECWRHLKLSELSSQSKQSKNLKVVNHFAHNKLLALEQINKAIKTDWPQPKLRLLAEAPTEVEGFFCFRALCEDFKGWHGQDVNRFVY